MGVGYLSTDKDIGNREDLTDILTNISPTRTPFISSIGRSVATGIYHEWQVDSLTAATTNAIAEGASAAAASATATTRVGNRCQILEKICAITNTQKKVAHAGMNAWERVMQNKMKEIARDLEYACVYNSAQSSGEVTADTARYMMGLACGAGPACDGASSTVVGWLSANNYYGTAAGGAGMVASGRTNLTETLFNNVLQLIWEDGGDPTLVLVGGYNKRVISSFTGNGTRFNTTQDTKKLAANIRIYESDFGSINIQESHFIAPTKLAAVDPNYFALAELRPLMFEELAKTGDRLLAHYVMEVTLEAQSPDSGGSIFGLASGSGLTAAFS